MPERALTHPEALDELSRILHIVADHEKEQRHSMYGPLDQRLASVLRQYGTATVYHGPVYGCAGKELAP